MHFSCKIPRFSSRGGGIRTHTVGILSPRSCVSTCSALYRYVS
jgi:hypothetical protein